jgi:hypothetical protein
VQHLQLNLPDDLMERLSAEASALGMSAEERVLEVLEPAIAPAQNLEAGAIGSGLATLKAFLARVPAIKWLSTSTDTEPYWWVKLQIDLDDTLAWNVVQELGFVLNYLALEEPLPTVFKPVSPPPYMNGGPKEFLSWVIEAKLPFLDAEYIAKVLEGRLPNPGEDRNNWNMDDLENDA